MAADPRAFNGSTLTFGSLIAKLIGMQYRSNGTVIDVTEPADTEHMIEVGQPDVEVTATVKRMPGVAVGAINSLLIDWNDGSNTTLGDHWAVSAIGGGGSQDGPISGDITFKPTVDQA